MNVQMRTTQTKNALLGLTDLFWSARNREKLYFLCEFYG